MTNTRLHFGQRQQAERMAENGDQLDQCFELVTARAEIERLKAHEHAAATILATALACDNYQPQHMEWMAEAARWLNEPRASHEPCEPHSCQTCGFVHTGIVGASRDADHCDFPDCEQHWTLVIDWALAAMKKLHESAEPDTDHPEIPAIIPAGAFRAFVDEHARLMRIRASAPQGASRDASGHHCLDCGADLSNHPTAASAHRCSPQRTNDGP